MAAAKSQTFLTNDEAAEMLGIRPGTLATWRWKRKGPKVSPSGNKIRYRVSDVERWIEENAAAYAERGA